MSQATGINIGGDLTETGKVEQNEFVEISSPAEAVGSVRINVVDIIFL